MVNKTKRIKTENVSDRFLEDANFLSSVSEAIGGRDEADGEKKFVGRDDDGEVSATDGDDYRDVERKKAKEEETREDEKNDAVSDSFLEENAPDGKNFWEDDEIPAPNNTDEFEIDAEIDVIETDSDEKIGMEFLQLKEQLPNGKRRAKRVMYIKRRSLKNKEEQEKEGLEEQKNMENGLELEEKTAQKEQKQEKEAELLLEKSEEKTKENSSIVVEEKITAENKIDVKSAEEPGIKEEISSAGSKNLVESGSGAGTETARVEVVNSPAVNELEIEQLKTTTVGMAKRDGNMTAVLKSEEILSGKDLIINNNDNIGVELKGDEFLIVVEKREDSLWMNSYMVMEKTTDGSKKNMFLSDAIKLIRNGGKFDYDSNLTEDRFKELYEIGETTNLKIFSGEIRDATNEAEANLLQERRQNFDDAAVGVNSVSQSSPGVGTAGL
ncbi:MAG: hypothetical protein LBB09_00055 [Rickettsiales bacterium]|jgi:hypothetical protein|nr:hypothetical protein [Rickettsiales bacterium]